MDEEHFTNIMNQNQIVSFIWSVADLIRDTFKRGKYQDVILPFTVLRRLDCVLEPTKEKVRHLLNYLLNYKSLNWEEQVNFGQSQFVDL